MQKPKYHQAADKIWPIYDATLTLFIGKFFGDAFCIVALKLSSKHLKGRFEGMCLYLVSQHFLTIITHQGDIKKVSSFMGT